MITDSNLTRIGIFYDGNFFFHVSNYYLYEHSRQSRVSITGLHQFIVSEIAREEERPAKHCRIVDVHYFRGRVTAHEAQARDLLFKERLFDDILMKEGVITHYLPMSPEGEKGIDVWLALEAFELAIFKKYDVIALIASDGDYLPLIRKLNTIGARVMVVSWDFEYEDQHGNHRATKTSHPLRESATYPVLLNEVIDDPKRKMDPLVNALFVKERFKQATVVQLPPEEEESGKVVSLLDEYGFIRPDQGNEDLFFHENDLKGELAFKNLALGSRVTFMRSSSKKGPCAMHIGIQ